jgi:uncharacterized membrane protein YgcG
MMMTHRETVFLKWWGQIFLLLGVVALVLTLSPPVSGQDPTPEGPAITIENAVISEITDEGVIVNGLLVIFDEDDVDMDMTVGTAVNVIGILQTDGTVIVISINVGDNDNDELTPTITVTPQGTAEVTPPIDGTPTPSATSVTTPTMTVTPDATEEASDGDVIIVVEGPVQQINVNIITIYNINIDFDRDDPVLTVIQLGDVIRVRGITSNINFSDNQNDDDDDDGDSNSGGLFIASITIIAIDITFISVEVVIIDGLVWRDSGDCSNAPPEAVLARDGGVTWLLRCRGGGGNSGASNGGGNNGGGNSGGGGNNDNDNDDDDDD